MSQAPSPPWTLRCPWCDYHMIVYARGGRGQDQGSGYEAGQRMAGHVDGVHAKTWAAFLAMPTFLTDDRVKQR